MLNRSAIRMLVVVGLVGSGFIAVAPSAAAHDPDCLFSMHIGTIRHHAVCDPRAKDESDCMFAFNILLFHHRVFCA